MCNTVDLIQQSMTQTKEREGDKKTVKKKTKGKKKSHVPSVSDKENLKL